MSARCVTDVVRRIVTVVMGVRGGDNEGCLVNDRAVDRSCGKEFEDVANRYGGRMTTARFLHAADLHLGSPLKSLGDALSEDVRHQVLQRAKEALNNLVATARREKVDFVVLAGDVYDQAERDPAAERRFVVALRQLDEAGIPVFIAHGNHDPLVEGMNMAALPESVVVFPAGEIASRTVTMSNGAEVVVAGVSYGSTEEPSDLVPLFSGLSGRTVVGVLHTNVGGNSQHGNYAPSTDEGLSNAPVHYWALGHIHEQTIRQTPRGWWAYPGNLQGRHAKSTECGPKGVLIVDVTADGQVMKPRPVTCAEVRFERVTVDVSDVSSAAEVNDAVNDALSDALATANGAMVMARVELTGTTDLEVLWSDSHTSWPGFVDELREEAATVLGGGAVTTVVTSCTPRIDLDAERERNTLLGIVLRDLEQRAAEPDAPLELINAARDILVQEIGGAR